MNYNYSNIEIKAAYTNQSITEDTIFDLNSTGFINLEVQYINNRQIAMIKFPPQNNDNYYQYIIFEINERTKLLESEIHNLTITIVGACNFMEYNNNIQPLSLNVPFYNYLELTNNSTIYYLEKGKHFILEFASCSNDYYTLSFTCQNQNNLIQYSEKYRNGIIKYIIETEFEDNLFLTLSLRHKNEFTNFSKVYYYIQYRIITDDQINQDDFYIEQKSYHSATFNYSSTRFHSNWGKITNVEHLNPIFNYYLFNKTKYMNESICFVEEPVYHEITHDFTVEHNIGKTEFEYQSVVVASFYLDYQYNQLGYNIKDIGYKLSSIWLWLLIIFLFILVFFGFTTFTLYKQIKTTDSKLLLETK